MRTRDAHALARHDEFTGRLDAHRGIVLKVAHAYARDADDRADLAQEIAAQAWRAWPKYDAARAAFSTWLYRIALNVAIDAVRGERLRRAAAVPLDETLHGLADGDAHDPEAEQHLRLLHRFIERQPPLDRALLLLYLEERSQREIGQILGLSETNVSTRIGRLKQRLRDDFHATHAGATP